jgi:peroxisomal 2,4-dienoyl-CoA reductase
MHTCRRFVSGETLVVDGAAWLHRPQLVPRHMVSALSRKVESKSRQVGTAAGGSSAAGAARSKL